MTRLATVLCFALVLFATAPALAQSNCPCVLSNNGGSADLMPQCSAGYIGSMTLSDGLPAGTTIEISATLTDFINDPELPGGVHGGDIQSFDASLEMQFSGTGSLAGFNRFITMPVSGVAHSSPRSPGDALQILTHEIRSLQGEVFGDPDFCTLRLEAGADPHGLPSPGQTTLTRQGPAGSDFEVYSFFDIQYAVDWQGCPGSILDGYSGTDSDTRRFLLCEEPVANESASWGLLKSDRR